MIITWANMGPIAIVEHLHQGNSFGGAQWRC